EPPRQDQQDTSPPAEQYYQLTHDYLVPAVREWLRHKKKETWRSRAELRKVQRRERHDQSGTAQVSDWWQRRKTLFLSGKEPEQHVVCEQTPLTPDRVAEMGSRPPHSRSIPSWNQEPRKRDAPSKTPLPPDDSSDFPPDGGENADCAVFAPAEVRQGED